MAEPQAPYKVICRFMLFSGWQRFSSVTVPAWDGSSGSSFRFRRFLSGKGVFCFSTVLTESDGSVSGCGSWKTVLTVPVPLPVPGPSCYLSLQANTGQAPHSDREIHTPHPQNRRWTSWVQNRGGVYFAFFFRSDNSHTTSPNSTWWGRSFVGMLRGSRSQITKVTNVTRNSLKKSFFPKNNESNSQVIISLIMSCQTVFLYIYTFWKKPLQQACNNLMRSHFLSLFVALNDDSTKSLQIIGKGFYECCSACSCRFWNTQIACSFCHFDIVKEFPRFGRTISAKIGGSRLKSAKNRPQFA